MAGDSVSSYPNKITHGPLPMGRRTVLRADTSQERLAYCPFRFA